MTESRLLALLRTLTDAELEAVPEIASRLLVRRSLARVARETLAELQTTTPATPEKATR